VKVQPGAVDGIIVFVALGIAVIALFWRHLMPAYRIGTRQLRAEARRAFKGGLPATDPIVNAAAIEWAQQRIAIFGYLALFSMTGTLIGVAVGTAGTPLFSILLTIWFMSITARLVRQHRSFSSCVRLASLPEQMRSMDDLDS
jgi:hypothetical protein